MKPFTALLGAAAGTHAADQLALATLPLTATLVLGAGPGILGLLVAAQSAAWLLVTLPAGAWVDRMPRRTLLIVGLGLGLAASVVSRGRRRGRHACCCSASQPSSAPQARWSMC